MNKKGFDLVPIMVIVFIVVVIVGFLYTLYSVVYDDYSNAKLCHSNFGVEYSFWNIDQGYNYKNVNEHHYNCCWEELSFDEEKGYYENIKCKGFFKEVKQ